MLERERRVPGSPEWRHRCQSYRTAGPGTQKINKILSQLKNGILTLLQGFTDLMPSPNYHNKQAWHPSSLYNEGKQRSAANYHNKQPWHPSSLYNEGKQRSAANFVQWRKAKVSSKLIQTLNWANNSLWTTRKARGTVIPTLTRTSEQAKRMLILGLWHMLWGCSNTAYWSMRVALNSEDQTSK